MTPHRISQNLFTAAVVLCAACASDDGGEPAGTGGQAAGQGGQAGQPANGGNPTSPSGPATGGQAAGGAPVGGAPMGGSTGGDAGLVPPPVGGDETPPEADAGPAVHDAAPPPGPDVGTGYASCDEAPGAPAACFSNLDCPADRACRNIGTPDLETPCCVPGVRGALPAGSPCDPATGETQCETSVCIDGPTGAFCSTTCQQNADCPVGMQDCTYIAFSASEDMWCFPEVPE